MFSELICPSTRIRKSVLVYAFLALITAFVDPLALSILLGNSFLTALGNNFFLFLLFALLLTLLFAVLLLGRCSSSGRVLSFIRSAILDTKLHFPNVALMWLLKSIAVIIMCSRPSKKTTFLIFYLVQQHENSCENLNSDKLIVFFSLGKG